MWGIVSEVENIKSDDKMRYKGYYFNFSPPFRAESTAGFPINSSGPG